PFTGEGIGQAIETGVAAAQSIAEGGRRSASSEEVGRAYIWALGETLAPDHRLARLCTSLMGRPLAARGAVRVTGLTPWLNRQVGRWLYEDFPRSLVLAPWRWRPGTLARPAAYR
ncbi:MAG: putative oxidoreductase, partial [Acidimicrobiaceae bacterium]|nr:putative oxidoreductase [Acidimicrobiaceae bacterium]